MPSPVSSIADSFAIEGAFLDALPHGSGHINDTYAATYDSGGNSVRYIFQRVNERIFKNAGALMENIARVTSAAAAKLEADGTADAGRRTLRLVPAKDGGHSVRDGENRLWRCYHFIEGAKTYDVIENPRQAYEAARAFGRFQELVSQLDGPRLHETIPDFHHTRARFRRLREVSEADPLGRLASARAEWDFIRRREDAVDVLLELQASGPIPERVTHNDTKLNNVMIDDATQEGVCVIDLDTVMPGLALYDFGDLVRTATSPAAEDERDLSKVRMQMEMFEALARGYLSSAADFLVPAEVSHLAFSGKLITLEIGIRFLTDHLEGDVYFKTKRPGHNIDRCRTQLALVRSIEEQMDAMEAAVREAAE
jgi:aminoglycoside phosphotransferase (APT) family kinase protein